MEDQPRGDIGPIRLPAALDTLAALRLPRLLRDGAVASLSGRDVETVGLAALQWLAAAVTHRTATLAEVSAPMAAAARDAGLGPCLLGDPASAGETEAPVLRLADAALDFGREPLAMLGAMRAAGIGIDAVLPGDTATLAAPDRLAIRFRLRLPRGMDRFGLARMIEPFADCADIADGEDGPAPAMLAQAAAPFDPGLVAVAAHKLAELAGIAAELVIAQAALIDRLGDRRGLLAAEVAEAERLGTAMQDAVLAIGLAPLDTLLGPIEAGGAIEIERAVADRVAGPLAQVRTQHRIAIDACSDGGFVRLDLVPPPPMHALEPLAAAARGAGGRIERDERRAALVLPRSLSLLDAIIVEVAASSYALPVQHMVEALQPTTAQLDRMGPERLLLRFRDRRLPVIRLGARMGLAGGCADPLAAVLIVVRAEDRQVALMVDAISDQRQIVAMPFAGGLQPPPGTTGAAIVRGNRIALILDVAALA